HWNYGGVLIFRTRGAMPVFVDGRASTAYPDALLRDYFKLVQPEFDEAAWDTVLEKYKIDTVLWVKAHDALRRFLVGKRGWKEALRRIVCEHLCQAITRMTFRPSVLKNQ